MSDFNPEMLILARESRALSQSGLARESGVPQDYISRYENGLRPPSEKHLRALAQTLGYDEAFLVLNERRYRSSTGDFHYRKRQSLSVKARRQVDAKVDITRIQITKLIKAVTLESPYSIPALDLEQLGSPAAAASELRRIWHVPSGPISNMTALTEDAGGIIVPYTLARSKMDGQSLVIPGLPPLIYVDKDIPGDRARWTLAHEVGHISMHGQPGENPEREADMFAAEFLMPAQDIRPELRIRYLYELEPLKARWKVSMQSLLLRAKDLGTITRQDCTRLYKQLSKAGYRTSEPVFIPREEPTLLKRIFDAHFDELGYSMQDIVRTLCIDAEEFKREYAPVLGRRFEKHTRVHTELPLTLLDSS